ncbi:MAG TPA: FAD-binding oxidoreductase [Kofleriaceae bacterium]|jgi:FAD/FMN-containing dehydrogenase|nr:FAD-binding oxidoreductase [Kofleriaceae bacterium]
MTLQQELIDSVGAPHVEPLGGATWRVTPGSAPEVAEVIRRARGHQAAVHPLGAGGRPTRAEPIDSGPQRSKDRNLLAARVPPVGTRIADDRPRVYIATRRLDQVLQLDEASLLVHAQAGLTGLDLERVLGPRNLSIGDYPPVVLTSSLGGIIAVRTPGKSSARHGFFEDAVVGLSAVLADGRTVHTRVAPRRSTGPDLARALCGSEGTIGFITSAVLRIHVRPEARLVAAYRLPSVDAAVDAVYLSLREEVAPSGLRIYDAASAALHFDGLALPAGHALLCAGTAGPTDLAACDRDLIASAVAAEGGGAADQALAELWWRRTHAGEPTPGPQPTLQVMATPSRVLRVYHAVIGELAGRGGAARAHISRFDADGAVVFFTLSPDDGDAIAAAERAAEAAGGWLLGARAHRLDAYLRELRDALDPDRIMNPGALA